MRSSLLLLSALLLPALCGAQPQHRAYGVRGGFAAISNGEADHAMFAAYYDVPMGAILFAPELVLLTAESPEPAYGIAVKIRREIVRIGGIDVIADVGGQFVVWDTITTAGGPPKRAHVGIPLDVSAVVPMGSSLNFELTLTYSPLFFLGADPYRRSLFGALAGIRILVP